MCGAFHSLTVAIFCKSDYWSCHRTMGLDSIGFALSSFFFLQKIIKILANILKQKKRPFYIYPLSFDSVKMSEQKKKKKKMFSKLPTH